MDALARRFQKTGNCPDSSRLSLRSVILNNEE
jgi:hypothetical protein